jgi:hypothetical protein
LAGDAVGVGCQLIEVLMYHQTCFVCSRDITLVGKTVVMPARSRCPHAAPVAAPEGHMNALG